MAPAIAAFDPLALPPVPPPAPDRHPWRDRALLLLIALALALPGLALVSTGSRTTTRFENRPTAPWPQAIGTGFTAAFERAFADRFGGRDELIALHHLTLAAAFQVSPIDKVVVGRRGWLFYADEGGVSFKRRQLPPDARADAEARAIAAGIEQRIRFLTLRGVRYLLVIAPDKQTIYPENLPAPYRRLPERSRIDALLAVASPEVKAHVLDLRGPLLQAKQRRQVYFSSDSHWNHSGGWVASREILAALRRMSGLPELPEEPLPSSREDGAVSGDLVKMLGVPGVFGERQIGLVMPPTWADCARGDTGAPPVWGAPSQLLRCPTAAVGKVAIYHDSMGIMLASLLPHGLQASQWAQVRPWDLGRLAAFGPDIVVDEIVERNLPQLADTGFLGSAAAAATTPAPR